jgi:hypothetical protein
MTVLRSSTGILFTWLLISACGAETTSSRSGVFIVQVGAERFRIRLTDATRLGQAREHLASGRIGVVGGDLVRGDGGFNQPYGWHLAPESVHFPDAAAEVCDGVPSDVQSDLDYWVDNVGNFCPWGARLVDEL